MSSKNKKNKFDKEFADAMKSNVKIDMNVKTTRDLASIDYDSELTKYLEKLNLPAVSRLKKILKDGLLAFAPMVCEGESCIYAERCPFLQEGIAPVGKACILELIFIEKRKREYIKKFEVDIDDGIELRYIEELLLLDLYEMRINADLSKKGMFETNVHVVSNKGDAYTRREVSPAWNIRKEIVKARADLLREFKQYKRQKYEYEKEKDDFQDFEDITDVNTVIDDYLPNLTDGDEK